MPFPLSTRYSLTRLNFNFQAAASSRLISIGKIMDSQSEKTERKESRLQFNKQLFKTYLALDHWHRFRLRLFLEGILVGIAGGLLIALSVSSWDWLIPIAAVCFRKSLSRLSGFPISSPSLGGWRRFFSSAAHFTACADTPPWLPGRGFRR